MKKYILAGIMAAALMASGCGKFVRDELITMQNEIDQIHAKVEEMNLRLMTLHGIVSGMASNGYIVDVQEFENEERSGYTLVFRSVRIDDSGRITSDDTYSINLNSGIDGEDGKDAEPFVLGVRQDPEDGRWYWYDVQADDWMYALDGSRFLVDGKDGLTPMLKIVDGYWSISWDGGETWETTEWKAKGDDAEEFFSKAEVFEDRVELTLAADSTLLVLPRYLPVSASLSINGEALADTLAIAPGDTLSIAYTLTGTGAEKAVLAAGTDGRLKTAIRQTSATEGFVDVICPEVFPEGGYIYITVNDGNGRSTVQVIRFVKAEATAPEGGEGSGEGSDAGNGDNQGGEQGSGE